MPLGQLSGRIPITFQWQFVCSIWEKFRGANWPFIRRRDTEEGDPCSCEFGSVSGGICFIRAAQDPRFDINPEQTTKNPGTQGNPAAPVRGSMRV